MSKNLLNTKFDAIVVGSGATGGIAALGLTQKGLKTIVLEAGPDLKKKTYGSPFTNTLRQLKQHWFSKNQKTQEVHTGYWETNPKLFVNDNENPYSTPENKPFYWIRGRQVGGRSHTWGGVCLRFSDYEFKMGWPISHRDMDSFYSRVEQTLNVHGSRENLSQLPDGAFNEATPLTPGEIFLKKEIKEKFNRDLIISRGIRAHRYAEKGESHSRLSSNQTSLKEASKTSHLTLKSGVVVSRILIDEKTKKAIGVECIETQTGSKKEIYAPLVVLCASSIESVRILMNSKSETFPNGIGASTGMLGKAIMDHIVNTVFFYLPKHKETSKFHLLGSDGLVIPRYNLDDTVHRGFGFWGGVSRMKFPPFLRKKPGTALGFVCCMGEALPSHKNFVEIDPKLKDKWGIPAVNIHYEWTPEDLKLSEKMRNDAIEMVKSAGAVHIGLNDVIRTPPFMKKIINTLDARWKFSSPGLFVHEVGGAQMGSDPKTSVTNPYSQVWDCPNVVIGDGATFVSSGWQNPTLTEMALCLRASEHAADELRAGRL
ncbi:MAG: GMC family oxidoreductase [Xanthomonadaceae bacterium]|nr:GMC family oxidoreductase [Xanthomonadaceae bacterium]